MAAVLMAATFLVPLSTQFSSIDRLIRRESFESFIIGWRTAIFQMKDHRRMLADIYARNG
jgi:hypothetical protein